MMLNVRVVKTGLLALLAMAVQSCSAGEPSAEKRSEATAGTTTRESGEKKEKAEEKAEENLAEVKPGTLPPLLVGAQYGGKPPPKGEDYGLKPPLNLPARAEVKVYRVKRWVPGTTLKEGKAYAKKFGLEKYVGLHETAKEPYFLDSTGKGYFRPWVSAFTFYSSARDDLKGISNLELEAMARKHKMTVLKARKAGFDFIKDHKLMPESGFAVDLENGQSAITTDVGTKVECAYLFEYHGTLDGRQVVGPGARLRFRVILNGKLTDLTIAWAEVEPLGTVKCKTRRQAYATLNSGRAGPVEDELVGGRVGSRGFVYYAEGPGGTVLHPCFEFGVNGKKGDRGLYFVPAAKDKYFKDPKNQVKVLPDIR